MSMKSMTIIPPMSLSLSLPHDLFAGLPNSSPEHGVRKVLALRHPVLTSITVKASVLSMTMYPPDRPPAGLMLFDGEAHSVQAEQGLPVL